MNSFEVGISRPKSSNKLDFIGAGMYKAATVSTNGVTPVTFSIMDYNPQGDMSDDGIYTCSEDGIYQITGSLVWDTPNDQERWIVFAVVNGDTSTDEVLLLARAAQSGINWTGGGGVRNKFLRKGDTVQIYGFTPRAINLVASNNYHYFSVQRIG